MSDDLVTAIVLRQRAEKDAIASRIEALEAERDRLRDAADALARCVERHETGWPRVDYLHSALVAYRAALASKEGGE